MKKLIILFILLLHSLAIAKDIDTYSEDNFSIYHCLNSETATLFGQSFVGNGQKIDSAMFYLRKYGNADGNVYANIYTHDGLYGESSRGGELLASSDPIETTKISSIGYGNLYEFNFNGNNRITLTKGEYFVLLLEYSGGDKSNVIEIGGDNLNANHSGNACAWMEGYGWTVLPELDICFYIMTSRRR